uniref:NAD(P)(+)--arginine ADP-ribosyltransferase n=1 Tax=Sphaeramia orbicularis TaxID=375764 RepID=A0A672ZRE0_9TELE
MNAILSYIQAFLYFTQLKVTAETREELDIAPDAVDDLYDGCNKEALDTFIHSGVLKAELNSSDGFQKVWNPSECSKVIPGGLKEHTAALRAYANEDYNFIKTFDDAVQTKGTNVSTYQDEFHFKSLHFLLMDSMRLLSQKTCKTVYDFAGNIKTAQKGSTVRFGRFNSVHSSFQSLTDEADIDGDEAILNITSCFFVELGENICSTVEMALLSPVEEFTVEDVKQQTKDDTTFTMIVLKHFRVHNMSQPKQQTKSLLQSQTKFLTQK